jgi:hypothetical protein
MFFDLKEKFDIKRQPGVLRWSTPPSGPWKWSWWIDSWLKKLDQQVGSVKIVLSTAERAEFQEARAKWLKVIVDASAFNEPINKWWRAVFEYQEEPKILEELFGQLTNNRFSFALQVPEGANEAQIEQVLNAEVEKAMAEIKKHLKNHSEKINDLFHAKKVIEAARPDRE